jgi:hypothetical protein
MTAKEFENNVREELNQMYNVIEDLMLELESAEVKMSASRSIINEFLHLQGEILMSKSMIETEFLHLK